MEDKGRSETQSEQERSVVQSSPPQSIIKSPIFILHLEDNSSDAALVQSTLEDGGILCTITRAQDHDGFVAALESGNIDLILSDFQLPSFDGISALKIARYLCPATPL